MPDVSWNGCGQGRTFSSSRSVNREDGFRFFNVLDGNGRERCFRCSAGSTSGEVDDAERSSSGCVCVGV